MTDDNELIEVEGAQVPVWMVREHTADLDRFLRLLPEAMEMQKLETGSPEWQRAAMRVNARGDLDALADTHRELSSLYQGMSTDLRMWNERRKVHDDNPPPSAA